MAKYGSKDLDSFWDISDLVPKKKQEYGVSRSVGTAYIESDSPKVNEKKRNDSEENTIIKKYIPPYNGAEKLSNSKKYVSSESYFPQSTLIHKVVVKKLDPSFTYYAGFLEDAKKYMNVSGEPCEYVQFFSYVPQYDQLNKAQLSYYLWFRENERQGKHIKTDYGYLFLYIYELINLGAMLDVKVTQNILSQLWNTYHSSFPAISTKLATWIIDFSLVHHLPAPPTVDKSIINSVVILNEFYINLPEGDTEKCARSLLKYCSSYDFRSSKFYNAENSDLFDRYIYGAIVKAVDYYKDQGGILSNLDFGDSYVERDAFAGAVCVHTERYRVEVSYCSFSRSNELRFLIGDMVKYAENKLRAYIGIKSRISVYSVTPEMRKYLDEYFANSLPSKKAQKVRKEKNDYDVLYELPAKKLSLSDAARIEEESWNTTRELVDAFEGESKKEAEAKEPLYEVMASGNGNAFERADEPFSEEKNGDILSRFGRYGQVLKNLLANDNNAVHEYASANGKMIDAVVDEINEISTEIIGDFIIEDDGEGHCVVVDDYRDMLERILNGG